MKTPNWFLERNIIAWLLLPVSWLYLLTSRAVFFYRSFWQKSAKRPVICIGNILAGGVGKTPIVREVARLFPSSAIVMQGYKGKKAGKVGSNDTAADVGDEAKMLAASGLPVFVGKDRLKSIKMVEKAGFSHIIMDDGFQNPTVKKDISIPVFDGKIGIGNGFILPAGPLREPLSAIKRADAVIIMANGESEVEIAAKRYKKPVFLAKSETHLPSSICHLPFIAFAGIGYPKKFFEKLPKRPVKTISFPDHYQYSDADLKKLFALAVKEKAELITTEKDWIRLPPIAQKKIKFAKLETTIEPAFWKWLEGKIK
ncbi:MAG: tetraacyldisaccharide 4'-kinase [Alphaproteobacteria bacterium]|nr:tetraacyldisaccharide 4'-kinase [Alphaproteobacteria bacterium]